MHNQEEIEELKAEHSALLLIYGQAKLLCGDGLEDPEKFAYYLVVLNTYLKQYERLIERMGKEVVVHVEDAGKE